MVGRSIRIIIPVEQQSEEDEVLRRLRTGQRVDHFETVRRRKDGSLVPISLTVSPVKDQYGRIVGASKIARDITERKAAEQALRQSIALKDQFLGLVSHELRTPISTIAGNAQLLLRRGERLDEAGRLQALNDIVAESLRFQAIIENLLVLTRVEAGRELVQDSVDLTAVVQEVVEATQRWIPDRLVSLAAAGGVPPAAADQTLVTMVLRNLIENAVKYSEHGSVVKVSLSLNEAGRPTVRVADRGIGIDADEIEKIFEPFYRTAPAAARATGMGLGLAVCLKVIAAQGGSLGVEPRTGGGSVFSFVLPAFVSPAS